MAWADVEMPLELGSITIDENEMVPRVYQQLLVDRAIEKNSIICLPTGSGKTHIAIMVIKKMKKDLIKPFKEGGKRTIFLVNNVPLVKQQCAVIKSAAPVTVGGYSSENNVDFWKKDRWDVEFGKYQVLVMTCQILVNILENGFMKLSDINLLILDEVHHAVEDHPMRQVMRMFESCPVRDQPRVVGLSATLLNANVKLDKVRETIEVLETTMHSTIATVDELEEVLSFSTNPHEAIVTYNKLPANEVFRSVEQCLNELINIVNSIEITKAEKAIHLGPGQHNITKDHKALNKRIKNIVTDCINQISILGLFGGSLNILAYIIVLERYRRNRRTNTESLFFKFIITHLHRARAMLEKAMSGETGMKKITTHSSEQILKILSILKQFDERNFNSKDQLTINKDKRKLSAIIFVKQRFTAKVLYNILKEVKEASPDAFDFLRHDFIVGFNVNPLNNTVEELFETKLSKTALLKFKKGDINCLISTSVIEEGIDIPQCSLVLRYDLPQEYRSYIQSKGRARCKTSSFVILLDNAEKNKFLVKYDQFQKCEKLIQELVIGKEREAPSQLDIKNDLYDDVTIQPFILPSGARITETSAISLLNQYCSLLPTDLYYVLAPDYIMEKIQGSKGEMILITIHMPMDSPIKEPIKGEPMPTRKLAKRSAALNACIKLYQIGALDPETALPKRYSSVDYEQADIKGVFLNWEDEEIKQGSYYPGIKKKLRKHHKVHPECFNYKKGAFQLHIITMETAFEAPLESRELALYNMLKSDRGFAILSHRPIDPTCEFPMFLALGEVRVNLLCNHAQVNVNKEMFEQVKEFHHLIFDQVLSIGKKYVAFVGQQDCAYVVPVTREAGEYRIDWAVIRKHKSIAPVTRPDESEQRKVRVTPDYQYSIVSPWYRGSIIPDRYLVSNILRNTTVDSAIDEQNESTYRDYYSKRYNLHILGDQRQPLLEAKQINSRLNCLLPRASTLNRLTGKQLRFAAAAQGDEKRGGYKECMVAEFCVKYDFPGVLWYKATALPSILHRIFMLQVANDLRKQIAKDTKLGFNLPSTHRWKPLSVSLDIATDSLLGYCDPDVRYESKGLSVDRVNNRSMADGEPQGARVTNMNESLVQLQLKKLEQEYPWEKSKEPMDIERNIMTATLMDIECYDEFMTREVESLIEKTAAQKSPIMHQQVAICPSPHVPDGEIKLLSKTGTGVGVELRDVLTALTVIKSHDTFNMERTETLGDSFLKFAVTVYLFYKFPTLNEGQLTNIKGRLIGNRNLFYAGRRVNLGGRIKNEPFSPCNDFIQPGFGVPPPILQLINDASIRPTYLIGVELSREEQLSGVVDEATLAALRTRLANDDSAGLVERETENSLQAPMQMYLDKQLVPDKVIADCVESLVGVYMQESGLKGGITVLQWLRVLPPQDDIIACLTKRIPTALTEKKTTLSDIDFLLNHNREEIEGIINYTFKDPSFLLQALSHPSYMSNRVTRSYERLELLGDALLDMLITAYVFERDVALKPGQLTDLRSSLVNNITFACYVVKMGLHKYILARVNPAIDKTIATFVQHQEQRGHRIGEDVLYLIDEEDCPMAQYVEVPKILSDVFESLAGAIFLDSGGDLQEVWRVYYNIMSREIAAFSKDIPIQPVRHLHEMINACPNFGEVKYIEKDIRTCMAPVTLTVAGKVVTVHGFGSNRHLAKRAAAKLAIDMLHNAR